MGYQTISYEVADDIAVITLDREDKMNALNAQMRAEIADAARQAPNEARVLVLTGKGRAFCSGQDLSDRANAANLDMERTLRDEYGPMLRAIFDSPIPTISAVNGPAAGAGANLALAADVVIASENAYFLQAFTRIGLIPDAGGTYWMTRGMGAAKAMGAALFADKISAKQADDWGLIWEAVADDAFDETWKARAAHLAAGPTAAYAQVKQAIRQSWDNTLDEQLELEGRLQGKAGKSRDFQEGVLAFLEKRKAHFEGR
ncbi:enoyl-CoA hydratase-related protein [Lutimaribacter sp. EGI FJ00015]|uniref:Enoyl-CoA hydratase-related protein n=1 Tax=Lutimaribacter degradans TaxID=2945989 RepID=A0ACC5ZXP5_9RHOB|nr:enoyl-CoA hydratase-related protein [Lutimaribacter sp. EGI FJ00013]MCM2562139.1 enoyl-CoA hydratase-related protein [Lutimaribacter sp. EGI FJ00013]MCO0613292.1 enoyl-CoA hydratase-related protein [Lutimaribacter sp. EGI FJ00015]MCO0636269.1 enoyl-CoA hydratase-related protein [Lutimaribacter sp. EGI FJ00014]